MTEPAIVFVYLGERPFHLDTAIQAASTYSPKCSIHAVDGNLWAAQGLAGEFAGLYQHYSNNSVEFERACLHRWFVLYEYCLTKGISCFWHFDNDVLVVDDLSQRLPPVGMTLPIGEFYCADLEQLRVFCQQMLEIYRQPEKLEPYIKRWQQKDIPGISDMVLAADLSKAPSLCQVNDYGYFDYNISCDHDGFYVGLGVKTVMWHEGRAYAYRNWMGRSGWVHMRSIHCWARKGDMAAWLEEARRSRQKAGLTW